MPVRSRGTAAASPCSHASSTAAMRFPTAATSSAALHSSGAPAPTSSTSAKRARQFPRSSRGGGVGTTAAAPVAAASSLGAAVSGFSQQQQQQQHQSKQPRSSRRLDGVGAGTGAGAGADGGRRGGGRGKASPTTSTSTAVSSSAFQAGGRTQQQQQQQQQQERQPWNGAHARHPRGRGGRKEAPLVESSAAAEAPVPPSPTAAEPALPTRANNASHSSRRHRRRARRVSTSRQHNTHNESYTSVSASSNSHEDNHLGTADGLVTVNATTAAPAAAAQLGSGRHSARRNDVNEDNASAAWVVPVVPQQQHQHQQQQQQRRRRGGGNGGGGGRLIAGNDVSSAQDPHAATQTLALGEQHRGAMFPVYAEAEAAAAATPVRTPHPMSNEESNTTSPRATRANEEDGQDAAAAAMPLTPPPPTHYTPQPSMTSTPNHRPSASIQATGTPNAAGAASAQHSAESPVGGVRPRHRRLSSPIPTNTGDDDDATAAPAASAAGSDARVPARRSAGVRIEAAATTRTAAASRKSGLVRARPQPVTSAFCSSFPAAQPPQVEQSTSRTPENRHAQGTRSPGGGCGSGMPPAITASILGLPPPALVLAAAASRPSSSSPPLSGMCVPVADPCVVVAAAMLPSPGTVFAIHPASTTTTTTPMQQQQQHPSEEDRQLSRRGLRFAAAPFCPGSGGVMASAAGVVLAAASPPLASPSSTTTTAGAATTTTAVSANINRTGAALAAAVGDGTGVDTTAAQRTTAPKPLFATTPQSQRVGDCSVAVVDPVTGSGSGDEPTSDALAAAAVRALSQHSSPPSLSLVRDDTDGDDVASTATSPSVPLLSVWSAAPRLSGGAAATITTAAAAAAADASLLDGERPATAPALRRTALTVTNTATGARVSPATTTTASTPSPHAMWGNGAFAAHDVDASSDGRVVSAASAANGSMAASMSADGNGVCSAGPHRITSATSCTAHSAGTVQPFPEAPYPAITRSVELQQQQKQHQQQPPAPARSSIRSISTAFSPVTFSTVPSFGVQLPTGGGGGGGGGGGPTMPLSASSSVCSPHLSQQGSLSFARSPQQALSQVQQHPLHSLRQHRSPPMLSESDFDQVLHNRVAVSDVIARDEGTLVDTLFADMNMIEEGDESEMGDDYYDDDDNDGTDGVEDGDDGAGSGGGHPWPVQRSSATLVSGSVSPFVASPADPTRPALNTILSPSHTRRGAGHAVSTAHTATVTTTITAAPAAVAAAAAARRGRSREDSAPPPAAVFGGGYWYPATPWGPAGDGATAGGSGRRRGASRGGSVARSGMAAASSTHRHRTFSASCASVGSTVSLIDPKQPFFSGRGGAGYGGGGGGAADCGGGAGYGGAAYGEMGEGEDEWEMNSSAYADSLDEQQIQWIEEQLRATDNPAGFF